jgi:site-specific DNA-cytosine methylase
MKYISICSGIEAASAAWHGLGWKPLAFSEIEPFPSAVLAHHYPDVPNLGDMSKYREWPEELLADCELLVGGTPCQAFSVAGLRKSLDDERGNLSLIYVHLFHHINAIRRKHGRSPAIALWENVPGVLSTKDNAFGCFISGLLGVDDTIETQDGKWPKAGFLGSETVRVGYRVLDAQYFGVAQRRRRVFLVAVPCELVSSLGERACPSEILSLRESVLGNPPSRGEAWKAVAGNAPAGASVGGGRGEPFHLDRAMFNQGVNAQYDPQVTNDGVAASMVARGPAAVGVPDVCGTLSDGAHMGGGLTDRTHTAVAYLPSVANTLTRRMHKGINTTVDEGQTPIVTTGGVFSESSAFGGNKTSGPIEVATTCLANKSPHGRMDFASETFVVEPPTPIATTGHPDPAYAISAGQQGKGGVFGSGRDSQDTFVVESKAVAFQSTLGTRGGDIYEDGTAPTVRVGSGLGIPSPPAVAFKPSHFTRGKDGRPDEITPPLSADADKGDQDTVVMGHAVGFNWQNGGGYGNANDGLGITEEGTGPLQRCNTPAVAFVKATNPHSAEEAPRFEEAAVAACLNGWDERHNPPKHVVAFTQNSRDEVRQIDGDGQIAGALSAEAGMHQTNYIAFKESQSGCRTGDVHATIDAHKGSRRQEGVMAFAQNQLGEVRTNDEVMGTVNTNQNASGRNTAMVHQAMQVRRLTPTECCRLQGFPDDRCDITFRKKPAADGPKYRALGNSMAVPCMFWLGYRIHKATE